MRLGTSVLVRVRARVLAFAGFGAVLLAASGVNADNAPENCPPGSVGKSSGSYGWCEPTVCIIDTDCGSGMVCRTLGLCMNAGSIDKTDGGTRLSVTNVCGANKSCPNDTVCSEKPRCVEPAVAERMHLVAPGAAPAPSASAAPSSEMMPKKSACGCHVVGASESALAPFGVALAICVAGLRRRRAPRSA